MMKFYVEVILILITLKESTSIQLEAVLVPQIRFRGQNATLLCKYDLESGEELYSLKWYKEDVEFYRYTPPEKTHHHRDRYGQQRRNNGYGVDRQDRRWRQGHGGVGQQGEVRTWSVPGIKINLKESSPQKVELKRVTFKSSGQYRCEVTTQQKLRTSFSEHGITGFGLAESINIMTVVELPKALPTITGGGGAVGTNSVNGDGDMNVDPSEIEYKPGDLLNLTCASAPSNPPAQLEWNVNGRPVSLNYVVGKHLVDEERGLFSSVIGLLLPLDESHFNPDGEIRVKCRATVEAEIWENNAEKNVYGNRKSRISAYSSDLQETVEKDRLIKVLGVQESQWPVSSSDRRAKLHLEFIALITTFSVFIKACFAF